MDLLKLYEKMELVDPQMVQNQINVEGHVNIKAVRQILSVARQWVPTSLLLGEMKTF